MITPNDFLTTLGGLVHQADQEEHALREYLLSLSRQLSSMCARAAVRCQSETIHLEDCSDDECVSGYLVCDDRGLAVASVFSGDSIALAPGEEVDYSLTSVEKCPLPWLRVISQRRVIEAFLLKMQEQILRGTDELRSRVVELATLALPPDHAAAAEFQKAAEDLGFGTIARDWRAAQVKTIIEPETAICAACTMIESVCKHILDDRHEAYPHDADLGVLVKSTRRVLGLDPHPSIDKILRRIVGGINSTVQGIGMLRNEVSNAHGKGLDRVSIDRTYAKFAVNAAGALAMFLLERWTVAKDGPRAPSPGRD